MWRPVLRCNVEKVRLPCSGSLTGSISHLNNCILSLLLSQSKHLPASTYTKVFSLPMKLSGYASLLTTTRVCKTSCVIRFIGRMVKIYTYMFVSFVKLQYFSVIFFKETAQRPRQFAKWYSWKSHQLLTAGLQAWTEACSIYQGQAHGHYRWTGCVCFFLGSGTQSWLKM